MKRIVRQYWPAAAGLVFTFALAFGIHLIRANLSKVDDYPSREFSSNEQLVNIEIGQAESGLEVAKDLYRNGVTASITSFYQLAISEPSALTIAPGTHTLNIKISAKQALKQLLDPKRNVGLISVIEGQWRTEIFAKLKNAGFSNPDKALSQLKVPKGFDRSEGIYFPAQYSFAKGSTTLQAMQAMVNRFQSEARSVGLLDSAQPYQTLIIASLVQAEGDPSDYSKISRVIYNRLKIGMPLQLDTTVQYVLKKRGSVFLSTKSTLIKSPYNTYKRYGLPPGPIGSPGSAAMKAALNPSTGDWLYFITVKPGDTRFTKSHDEFLNWKNLYEQNLKAGLFK